MADIRIEHKRGPGIWPWILGLLVLALVAWWLLGRDGGSETTGGAEPTVTAPAGGANP